MNRLLIIGAGGHGRVVADTARAMGKWEKIAFVDDCQEGHVLDWPVLGKTAMAAELYNEYNDLVIAIGDNPNRLKMFYQYSKLGFRLPAIIHPTAFVSPSATVDAGTIIFAQAAVNAGAVIGAGCIINTGATVDHDCVLADGVHLSPGVHLGGEVKIGRCSWLGVGASVINRVCIGESVTIGAGAVIIRPIEDNVTVVGVPGRVIKRNG